MMYKALRVIVGLVLKIFFRFKVAGSENVPPNGPCIIIANHQSLIDGFVLGASISRTLTFLSSSYLFEIPVVGWFLRKVRAIPVEKGGRNPSGLKRAIEVLNKGGALAIFPAGGIYGGEHHKGPLFLAAKTGAPLLPVVISGTDKVLAPGKKWPSLHSIEVIIGKPFCIELKGRTMREFLKNINGSCYEDHFLRLKNR